MWLENTIKAISMGYCIVSYSDYFLVHYSLNLWKQSEGSWKSFLQPIRWCIVYTKFIVSDSEPCPYDLKWYIASKTRTRFYQYGLTLIPAWISNHMLSKVWDKTTNLFWNFSGATDWIRSAFHNGYDYLSMLRLKSIHVSKGVSDNRTLYMYI